MSDVEDLQGVITRNVKILMVVRGIATNRELAKLLDQVETHVSNRIAGRRKWQVSDLAALGRAFGIEPGALLGDTAAVVQAAGPTLATTGVAAANCDWSSFRAPSIGAYRPVGAAVRLLQGPRHSTNRPSLRRARSHGVISRDAA